MNIAIFEDDRQFANNLETIITNFTHYPPLLNSDNPTDIERSLIAFMGASLYFLDIVAGFPSTAQGFELADKIIAANKGDLIVFITSHKEQIITNTLYKTSAFNVIYKDSSLLNQEIIESIDYAEKHLSKNYLTLDCIGRFEVIRLPHECICFIEKVKDAHKLIIHCTDGFYNVNGTLTGILAKLDSQQFVRCHQSYIVNLKNIRSMNISEKMIIVCTGESIFYSRLFFNPVRTFKGELL